MSEIEFGGMKFKGGKMFALLTALSTLGGALWGGFEFYKDYMDMKEIIQNLYEQLFGNRGKEYGHWVCYFGVELRQYLFELGLNFSKSFEKNVPKSIFKAQKSVIAAFIRGLLDTDGSVRITGRNLNSIEVNLSSTSKTLIEQTQQLLLNFGIISSIQKVDPRKYTGVIDDREVKSKRDRYHLRIKGNESVKIPYFNPAKNRLLLLSIYPSLK